MSTDTKPVPLPSACDFSEEVVALCDICDQGVSRRDLLEDQCPHCGLGPFATTPEPERLLTDANPDELQAIIADATQAAATGLAVIADSLWVAGLTTYAATLASEPEGWPGRLRVLRGRDGHVIATFELDPSPLSTLKAAIRKNAGE